VPAAIGRAALCRPWPSYISTGGGICATCSGRIRGLSEPQYRQRVTEPGGTILGDYVNTHTPVLVRCPEGRENRVIPKHVLKGVGICSTCKGNAPGISEPRFREAVINRRGEVLGSYVNATTSVLVRCSEGNEVRVQPNNVLSGQGICRVCRGRTWDVFYTVADDVFELLKFGVTSGDARARLRNHRLAGFEQPVRSDPEASAGPSPEETQAPPMLLCCPTPTCLDDAISPA
jgi:hypothetical protein